MATRTSSTSKSASRRTIAPLAAVAIPATAVDCPHCKKRFTARIDVAQPPRLQGAKCPHCKLFVPGRLVIDSQPQPRT